MPPPCLEDGDGMAGFVCLHRLDRKYAICNRLSMFFFSSFFFLIIIILFLYALSFFF
jgi:hypothetical protein